MSKKIVITGGLGYIGTELCKIYSGISWNNEILVIDNRFISERVNQLRNWGINYIHGDILDQGLIKKYLNQIILLLKHGLIQRMLIASLVIILVKKKLIFYPLILMATIIGYGMLLIVLNQEL